MARIMIEVRSDGTTTTSRGILESPRDGQRSEIILRGAAHSASLIALLRNLITASATARRVLRAVLAPGESGIDHHAQAPGDLGRDG